MRLRQLNPGNYRSNDRISAEFENIVRYLNAAELGNKTIGELLDILFNQDGEFEGPIEMRLDTSGLEYRVGTYTDPEAGWHPLASLEDIRGLPGRDFGTIGQPFIYGRKDLPITSGQTSFSYVFDAQADDLLVYVNGILQSEAAYTADASNNTITFTVSPYTGPGDVLTIQKVRKHAIDNYTRVELTAAGGQQLFAFIHDDQDILHVYKNGILQREGALYDYVASPVADQVVFTSPCTGGDLITIFKVVDASVSVVGGLMTEDRYTDGNGLIPYAKLAIQNDDIPQAKIAGLQALLANISPTYVSATEPATPQAGWYWIDTSVTPNVLRFYDGVEWLRTSPNTAVPDFGQTEALKFLRVNAAGNAMEFANVDLSSRIPMNYMAAANGVATLDAQGRVPTSQIPGVVNADTIELFVDGSVADATYRMQTYYRQKVRLTGITYVLSSGTCNIQISVDGSPLGIIYAVSNVRGSSALPAVIEIDASTTPKVVQIVVTSQSSASDLSVAISTEGVL